jgi:2-iminobutanoate/2-iminopropanoate deaminase
MSYKQVITSNDLPAPKGPYSPAVRAGGLVFVSGQGPIVPATGEVLRGSIEEQTELVLGNIRAILAAAGVAMEAVVKTTVYLADIQDFAAMNRVYATFFPTNPPARTTIQAANLPLGIGVEIEAIAAA